jgi:parallel beta-helix repeat protein
LFSVLTLCGLLVAVPSALASGCEVANTTTGEVTHGRPVYRLARAIVTANPGDSIEVTGDCRAFVPLDGARTFVIDKDLTIAAPGGATMTANGGSVLIILTGSSVTLIGLTIQGGTAAFGGGIANSGTLNLENSTVSGNTATFTGGGIYNRLGTVTLDNSTVSGNTAPSFGGGIYNFGDSTVTLENCTVSGNTGGFGGGIANDGTLMMSSCSVNGNFAQGGGGISNGGALTMQNSTVTRNTASSSGGGGIFSLGTVTYVPPPSIVSDNTPDDCSPVTVCPT